MILIIKGGPGGGKTDTMRGRDRRSDKLEDGLDNRLEARLWREEYLHSDGETNAGWGRGRTRADQAAEYEGAGR